MWTKAVTFEQFHRYWKEMCGYAKFTQPVASMAGSILIPPEVKIHTWKQCAQGAALLSANVTRIDVTVAPYTCSWAPPPPPPGWAGARGPDRHWGRPRAAKDPPGVAGPGGGGWRE